MLTSSYVVIPAAGKGTRLAPFTYAVAKETMPLASKPAFGYILQELEHAHAYNIALVANPSKNSLVDYIHHEIRREFKKMHCSVLYQYEPTGLADAIALAQRVTQEQSFMVVLPDDILPDVKTGLIHLQQMAQLYNYHTVIAVQKVSPELLSSYGIIGVKEQLSRGVFSVDTIIEKPEQDEAPSCYAVVGRYLLPAIVHDYIEKLPRIIGQERQLTHALQAMLYDGYPILAVEITGYRYDIGSPQGWLQAVLHEAAHVPGMQRYMQQCMMSDIATDTYSDCDTY